MNYQSKHAPILKLENHSLCVNGAFYGDMLVQENITSKEKESVKHLIEALNEVSISEVIEPGTMICIDNRVILHSRTAFNATFDQEGNPSRWVQRLFLTENLASFQDWDQTDDNVYKFNF